MASCCVSMPRCCCCSCFRDAHELVKAISSKLPSVKSISRKLPKDISRPDQLTELLVFAVLLAIMSCIVWLLNRSSSGDSLVELLFFSSLLLLASLIALRRGFFTFPDGSEKFDKQSDHYLGFLRICRNLFTLLTFCWLCFGSAVWDLEFNYVSFFMPVPVFRIAVTQSFQTMTLVLKGVHKIIGLTLAEGCVAFLFVGKYEQLERSLRLESSQKKHKSLRRALWLSDIPVGDQNTWQTYQLPVKDFGKNGVEGDLTKAIQDHLVAHKRHNDENDSCWRSLNGKFRKNRLCNKLCGCNAFLEKDELIRWEPTAREDFAEGSQQISSASQNSADSVCTGKSILSVTVQPVMEPYLKLIMMYNEILDEHEKEVAYKKLKDACGVKRIWRLNKCYYSRQQSRATRRKKTVEEDFKSARVNELRMSGHAFATFVDVVSDERDRPPWNSISMDARQARDRLLEERGWWGVFQDYTSFEFGRAPFSSVTLECRQVPHPSDIQWENLQSRTVCCSVTFLVLVPVLLNVGIIFHLALASQLDAKRGLCFSYAQGPQIDTAWQSSLAALCSVAFKLQTYQISSNVLRQLPTIMLLCLNAWVVPAWISCVLRRIGFYQHSRQELFKLRFIFLALLLSKFLVPLVSITAIYLGLELAHNGAVFGIGTVGIVLGPCQDVMSRYGFFVLQYIINCAFFGSIWSMLQLSRCMSSSRIRLWMAVTSSQKKLVEARREFPYGFWYAWSLSIAAVGLILSSIVPSLLPVTALFFWIKHSVDFYLFRRKAFKARPETSGVHAPQVVHYLSCIVSVKMIGIGAIVLLMQRVGDAPPCSRDGISEDSLRGNTIQTDSATSFGALLLIFLALVIWLSSCHGYLAKMLDEASYRRSGPSLQQRTCFAGFTNAFVAAFNSLFQDDPVESYDFMYTWEQHQDIHLKQHLINLRGEEKIPEDCLLPGVCARVFDAKGAECFLRDEDTLTRSQFPMYVNILQETYPGANAMLSVKERRESGKMLSTPLLEQDSEVELEWDARKHLQKMKKRQHPVDSKDIAGYEKLREELDECLKVLFKGPRELEKNSFVWPKDGEIDVGASGGTLTNQSQGQTRRRSESDTTNLRNSAHSLQVYGRSRTVSTIGPRPHFFSSPAELHSMSSCPELHLSSKPFSMMPASQQEYSSDPDHMLVVAEDEEENARSSAP